MPCTSERIDNVIRIISPDTEILRDIAQQLQVTPQTASQEDTVGLEKEEESGPSTWNIDTKYYEADVDVHFHTSLPSGTEDSCPALVLVLGSTSFEDFFRQIREWWSENQTSLEPDVKIVYLHDMCLEDSALAAASAKDGVTLQDWCIDNLFELVESDKVEDGGMKRVVEALQSNLWVDMDLKEGCDLQREESETDSEEEYRHRYRQHEYQHDEGQELEEEVEEDNDELNKAYEAMLRGQFGPMLDALDPEKVSSFSSLFRHVCEVAEDPERIQHLEENPEKKERYARNVARGLASLLEDIHQQ
eukprot:jgi/Picsp_1/4691/NSC_02060-R1_alpha- and gamma-adaptin-binding protein p34